MSNREEDLVPVRAIVRKAPGPVRRQHQRDKGRILNYASMEFTSCSRRDALCRPAGSRKGHVLDPAIEQKNRTNYCIIRTPAMYCFSPRKACRHLS